MYISFLSSFPDLRAERQSRAVDGALAGRQNKGAHLLGARNAERVRGQELIASAVRRLYLVRLRRHVREQDGPVPAGEEWHRAQYDSRWILHASQV